MDGAWHLDDSLAKEAGADFVKCLLAFGVWEIMPVET